MARTSSPSTAPFDAHTLVAEVLAHGPRFAPVFLRRGMACPGCVMAPFMTLAEAAKAYELELGELLADLAAATERLAGAPPEGV